MSVIDPIGAQARPGGGGGTQPAQVAALSEQCPHSIISLPSEHALSTYTCLVHALDFVGNFGTRQSLDPACC